MTTEKIKYSIISRTNQIGKIGYHYTSDVWDSHGFSNLNISSDKNIKHYNLIDV